MTDTATDDPRLQAAAVGMLVAHWAADRPDTPAVISEFGDLTFAELNAQTNQFVRGLRSRGLAAGDSIAIIGRNRPEWVVAWAACQRAGWRLTTVNWHLTGEEAAYIVGDCEAKALVCDARIGDTATGAVSGAPQAEIRVSIGGALAGFEAFESVIEGQEASNIVDPSVGGSMLYTSGTTGRPKGVYRPPASPATVTAVNIYGYRDENDRHLVTGPLYHAAPLAFSLNAPLAYGCGVVLMDGWDAEDTLRFIQERKITHTHMVPTMFHRLLSLSDDVRAKYDVSTLRFIIHGAAPCPVPVKQRLIDWLGPIVLEYYAATEGLGTFVDSNTWLTRPGTVGKPNPEGQVMVGDDEGNPVAANAIGQVYLKSPATGKFEYYKDPEKTSSSYRGDYFTLGDVGYMDDDGYLYLTDRSANLIISGGVNIYPAEVDAILLTHPAVGDAATIGIPNEEWGEEVRAVVELKTGIERSDELAKEMVAFCRERLAHYKCPRAVDFIDELPRQDNGKIYKRWLRDRYRTNGES
ncbi:MAG: AMP-binding protein [Acidimicrobiales bacterium]